MKIYEIGTGYTPIPARMGAATEIVVEELVKAMDSQGMSVTLVDIQAKDRLPNSLPIVEVPVPGCFSGTDVKLGILHKLKRVVYSISLAGKLAGILKKSQEKVILHFHNQYNMFFFCHLVPGSLRRKAVIAYTNHSYIWHDPWDQIRQTIKKRYFQEVFCVQHADCVFVLNEQTRDNLIRHVNADPEKVHLIDNGVNTTVYSPLTATEKEANAQRMGLSAKKVFVQVGSVCDRKNQMEALRLLLPLMQKDPGVVFCYAGGVIDPEYHQGILRFAEEQGVADQVRYFGELQPGAQLNEFYNTAEAMVFPSKAEGFSLVVIEAMSAGVPVVISRELQFRLAETCLCYGDGTEFETILTEQILEPQARETASRHVRAAVVEGYSWEKVARDYTEVFAASL